MRYYDLRIWREEKRNDDSKESKAISHKSSASKNIKVIAPLDFHISSYVKRETNGIQYMPGGNPHTDTFDPGALDISFEIIETDFANPDEANSGAYIEIKGIDPQTIAAASCLTGATVELRVGMGHGLPLTKPEQAGSILYGTVQTAYGNWVGDNLTLTIFVGSYGPILKDPNTPNLPSDSDATPHTYHVFNCEKGKSLKQAIEKALKASYPDAKVSFAPGADPKTELPDAFPTGQVAGMYDSFKALCVALAHAWEQATRVGRKRGERLHIISHNGTFLCYGERSSLNPIQITYEDLIGQPTWTGQNDITFCCPLRADLNSYSTITLPDEANLFGAIRPENPNNLFNLPTKRALLFHGTYQVQTLHHIGDFRNPDGQQWMTVVNCTAL